MNAFDGGYYLINETMIRGGMHKHTAAEPANVSDEMLDAINTIQATAWRVNTWVLDLMREAWVAGDLIGGLPSADVEPLPPRMTDEKWASMTPEARSEAKHALAQIHERNAKAEGSRMTFLSKLNIAEDLRDRSEIYFPHFMDFRGRFYPMAQDLTPQGDDVAKALLMFAKGERLGYDGIYWLKIRLANTFGQDKLSYEDRVKWVHDNEAGIFDSAKDPLDGGRFWTEADEPWSFLVTCREYHEAMTCPDDVQFVSHLPIPLDGTCNGLQHLSLMGRDPVGAKATNCGISDKREDLYSEIAEVVKRLVRDDVLAGSVEATAWMAKGITRSTVKRAVMTTPYGVTDRGIRDQLISDGHTSSVEGNSATNAGYMKDKIVQALGETVVAAKDIMAYFQATAHALAEAGVPMRWKTPAGMTAVQSYWNVSQTRIETLQGRCTLWDEDQDLGLNKRKQMQSSAPNIIHSFDAAHLALTAIEANRQGIHSFAFIHDSYGAHACFTTALSRILREQIAVIYADDQLESFEAFVRSYAPDVTLPERPKLGTFDVTEVLSAPYFFA